MIKVGLFLGTNFGGDEPLPVRYRDALEQVRIARDYGFASVAIGQHFLTEYQKLQPVPMLARLAPESGDMRLVVGVLLLPFFNPVYVAEEMATLDVVTEGRLVLGVGVGYRDVEFEGFGVKKSERAARFAEGLEVVKRLWTLEEASFEGRYFRLPKVRPVTRPLQKPHPPIWVAAQNDAGIRRAATMGDVLFMNPQATIATLARQARLFVETRREARLPPASELACMKEVYVAPDMDTALREARPYIEEKLKMYARWGQLRELPKESAELPSLDFDDLRRDCAIVGDPAHCIAEFKRYRNEVGINHFSVVLNWPGMEPWRILRSIQLLGEQVLPALQ
jgi:alkanesulfonate monooxygenase SsuD/methylene tetrahydromethanopterin reductase-like flavin-dependent oxidoreductase (luciferase family)